MIVSWWCKWCVCWVEVLLVHDDGVIEVGEEILKRELVFNSRHQNVEVGVLDFLVGFVWVWWVPGMEVL